MDYIIGVSWPRSGHHLLVRLLKLYLGPQFGYCDYYNGIESCCKSIPCKRADEINFTKSHDFEFDLPQSEGQKYLIQFRSFVPSVISDFELHVRNGGVDSDVSFRSFASTRFSQYRKFLEKWVNSEFAQKQIIVDYDDLLSDPVGELTRVVGWFDPDHVVDHQRLNKAITEVDGKKIEQRKVELLPGVGIHSRRETTQFRHYTSDLFDKLNRLTLTREQVAKVFSELLDQTPPEGKMLDFQAKQSLAELITFIRSLPEYKQHFKSPKSEKLKPKLGQATATAAGQKPAPSLPSDQSSMQHSTNLTRSDVELSYRLFLGRTPSEQEIDQMCKSQSSLAGLRQVFLNSDEFRKIRQARQTTAQTTDSATKTTIHLHIPKSAGSSLSRLLVGDTKRGERITVGDNTIAQLTDLPIAQQRKLTLIFGHLNHGVGRLLPQRCHYVSVLRAPGPRILSYYRYVGRTDHHPFYKTVHGQNMSFGDFLEFAETNTGVRMEIDNGQIRRLAGDMAPATLSREPTLLRRALHNVFAPNFTYGLTEYFDNFQKRLVRQGLLSASKSIRENAAEVPGDLDTALAALTPAQRVIYDNYIRWDTQFYDICKSVYFAKQNPKEHSS